MFKKVKNNFKSLLKEKNTLTGQCDIFSPVKGESTLLSEVRDPVFKDGDMGGGVAIIPEDKNIYSPISGSIVTVLPTKHAIGLKSDNGYEILLHIGINTVELNGRGFTSYVTQGDRVEANSLIMEIDLDLIKSEGYDTDIIVIFTNKTDKQENIIYDPRPVKNGDIMFTIKDK